VNVKILKDVSEKITIMKTICVPLLCQNDVQKIM